MVGFDILRRSMSVEAVKEVIGKTEATVGFVRPETWQDFVDVLERNIYPGRSPRSEYTNKAYEVYLWLAGKNGLEPKDVVLAKMGDRSVAMLPNDFPYDWLMEDLNSNLIGQNKFAGHFCLWNRDGQMSKGKIGEAVEKMLPGICEWTSFVNPPQHQSVGAIWHTHIFPIMDVYDPRLLSSPHRFDLRWTSWVGSNA